MKKQAKTKIPSVSFAITVCNEHKELEYLLKQLIPFLKENDEIVIQVDDTNSTLSVREVIESFQVKYSDRITHIVYPLNSDFAKFKNNLKEHCTKDYIFQIDADEYLAPFLLLIHETLLENPDTEAFWIPRINTVKDLDMNYAKSIGWNINEEDFYEGLPIINWPDLQLRLFKNLKRIKWTGNVHEKIVGHKTFAILGNQDSAVDISNNRKFSIIHQKTFERQLKQNTFYKTIGK